MLSILFKAPPALTCPKTGQGEMHRRARERKKKHTYIYGFACERECLTHPNNYIARDEPSKKLFVEVLTLTTAGPYAIESAM